MDKKRIKGQFYTKGNPFLYKPFLKWFEDAYLHAKNKTLLEPFAGSNSILLLMKEATGLDLKWDSYDIDPESNEKNVTDTPIKIRNVLKRFPKRYSVAITNPPYLAKNSATRRGIKAKNVNYDDLYKDALDVMLKNVEYVAAIIPETFINQNLFQDRLAAVISITDKMFTDTYCPVCLALFTPHKSDDFFVYSNDNCLGTYKQLKKINEYIFKENYEIIFNCPDGELGLQAIDNTKEESIGFKFSEEINNTEIKKTSRSATKIKLHKQYNRKEIETIIVIANDILRERRKTTGDVFLSPFKGLRKDGKYRRRIDYKQARKILNMAIDKVDDNFK